MLPTKFWAEMTWPDFQRADMSKVIAVLPVAAIEQHGPHLPVGVDAIHQRGLRQPRRPAHSRRSAGSVSALASHRRLERTSRLSGRADAIDRNRDPRLAGHRRERRARGLPQADRDQFAWRQWRGDRGGDSRSARALPDAGDQRLVAAPRLSRPAVFGPRGGVRNSWRRRRDLADARFPPRDGADEPSAGFSERRRRHGKRDSSCCAPSRPSVSPGWRATSTPKGRSAKPTGRARPRARPRRITASSGFSRCCATRMRSISPVSRRARWGLRHDPAALRLRAGGDGRWRQAGRRRRRGRARPARGAARGRGGHSRSRRSAGRRRQFEGAERGEARGFARGDPRQGLERLGRVRQRRGNRRLQHPRRHFARDGARDRRAERQSGSRA